MTNSYNPACMWEHTESHATMVTRRHTQPW